MIRIARDAADVGTAEDPTIRCLFLLYGSLGILMLILGRLPMSRLALLALLLSWKARLDLERLSLQDRDAEITR